MSKCLEICRVSSQMLLPREELLILSHKALGASPRTRGWCAQECRQRALCRSQPSVQTCSWPVHLTPFCFHTLDDRPCLLLFLLTSRTPCLSLLSSHLYLGSSSPVFHPGYPKAGRLCLERRSSKWYLRSYYSSKILIGSTATALSGRRREAA